MIKRILTSLFAITVGILFFAGCLETDGDISKSSKPITVISREDGSGTRGAFTELLEVTDENGDDATTREAVIASSTAAVIRQVSADEAAIGYISMGSLGDDVKAVAIDGVRATVRNVKDGSYKVQRPFNIAYKDGDNELVQDFIKFITSTRGRRITGESYIPVNESGDEYKPLKDGTSGKITVSGSSSVSPLMEKLIEAYENLNPGVTVELNTTDSTGGMNDAVNGVSDIGMASRELKAEEKEKVTGLTIAMDGIAVIVNNDNPVNDMPADAVSSIYTGKITDWNDIG